MTPLYTSPFTVKDWSLKGDFIHMGYTKGRKGSSYLILGGDEDIDFVRCLICGDHRRVISGRHLSKHDTDRETYMEEYRLTPDELIAKDFRMMRSSRRGFYPHGKSDLAALTLCARWRNRCASFRWQRTSSRKIVVDV